MSEANKIRLKNFDKKTINFIADNAINNEIEYVNAVSNIPDEKNRAEILVALYEDFKKDFNKRKPYFIFENEIILLFDMANSANVWLSGLYSSYIDDYTGEFVHNNDEGILKIREDYLKIKKLRKILSSFFPPKKKEEYKYVSLFDLRASNLPNTIN